MLIINAIKFSYFKFDFSSLNPYWEDENYNIIIIFICTEYLPDDIIRILICLRIPFKHTILFHNFLV